MPIYNREAVFPEYYSTKEESELDALEAMAAHDAWLIDKLSQRILLLTDECEAFRRAAERKQHELEILRRFIE